MPVSVIGCRADVTCDGFVDWRDYEAYLGWYESGDRRAEVTGDEFTDFFDYDAYVLNDINPDLICLYNHLKLTPDSFIAEARKLNIPTFAMVDTNSDPSDIDFPIPANDDAFKSISIITGHLGKAIEEALMERKKDKEEAGLKKEEEDKKKVDETVESN